MKNNFKNFLVLASLFLAILLSGQFPLLSKVGCNHPLQEGIGSTKKMITLLQKETKRRNATFSVTTINDTCYIVSDKMVVDSEVVEHVSIKFYLNQIVEISYWYEFANDKKRVSFCSSMVSMFQNQRSNFTEVTTDSAIHDNVSTFWNFISSCKGKQFFLAAIVEMLNTEKPSVCLTYLY